MNGWEVASRRLAPYLDPAVAVIAVGLALGSHLATEVTSIDARLHAPDLLSAAATVAAPGALAWRRSHPASSYAVMVAGCLVVSSTFHYIGLLSVLVLLSLYSLAAHGRRRAGLIGLGVGVACFVGLALADIPDLGTSVLLQSLALLVAAWALGDAIRSRRRQQRDQVDAAVAEERLRIARELHDVVAHSMSLIAIQAGVGAHVIRTDVDAAEQSLEVIADTSRKALEQTRSMLGLLRELPDDATRPPTHDVDDLAALLDDVRAAGLDVGLNRPGSMPGAEPSRSTNPARTSSWSSTTATRIILELPRAGRRGRGSPRRGRRCRAARRAGARAPANR